MNRYEIQHRIRTLATLDQEEIFSFRGIEFRPWAFSSTSGSSGEAWHASTLIEAPDVETAFKKFRSALFPIVDRIGFISQCYTTVEYEPYLILKINDNPSRTFFTCFITERNAVPLDFGEKERMALENLDAYEEKGDVFRLLREATNSPWFYTRFIMLVAALEAIAGEEIDRKGKKVTNHEYICDVILRDANLKDRIFKYEEGLRNQILHGHKIDTKEHANIDYIREIYRSILRYFQEQHNVVIRPDVMHPMRTPTENFSTWSGWLCPRNADEKIELRRVWELLKADFKLARTAEEERLDDVFITVLEPPEAY